MSSDNPVTDRLLSEARKKAARASSPTLSKVALTVGIIAVVVSPISILGWIVGGTAVGLGYRAARRPVSRKRARIAIVLGVAAILIGVAFYVLALILRR